MLPVLSDGERCSKLALPPVRNSVCVTAKPEIIPVWVNFLFYFRMATTRPECSLLPAVGLKPNGGDESYSPSIFEFFAQGVEGIGYPALRLVHC